tara:strand:- start:709 stop:1287 length:579 start_codon:yes stop_codon:yes gene_type:complete
MRDRNPTPIYEINEYIQSVRNSMPLRLSFAEAEDRINSLIFTLMDLNTWYLGCKFIVEAVQDDAGTLASPKQLWNMGSSGVDRNPTFMRQSPRFGTDTLFREFGEGKGVSLTIRETVSAKDKFVRELDETMEWIEFMFRNVQGKFDLTSWRIERVIDMVREQFPDMDLVQGYDRIGQEAMKRSEETDEDEQL